MTREEAIKFWTFRYENAKDFSDPHWEAQERREHREYVEALRMAIDALQTEVVHGEWGHMIADGSDGSHWYEYECSHCGEVVLHPYNFCPNCGTDMGGKA